MKAVEEFENCKKQLEQAKAALVQSQAALAQAQLDKKAAVEGRSKELGKIIEGQREYIIKLESQAMRESHVSYFKPQVMKRCSIVIIAIHHH